MLTTVTIPGTEVQKRDVLTVLGTRRAVIDFTDYPPDRWERVITCGGTRDSPAVRNAVAAGARVALLGDGSSITIAGTSRYTVQREADPQNP